MFMRIPRVLGIAYVAAAIAAFYQQPLVKKEALPDVDKSYLCEATLKDSDGEFPGMLKVNRVTNDYTTIVVRRRPKEHPELNTIEKRWEFAPDDGTIYLFGLTFGDDEVDSMKRLNKNIPKDHLTAADLSYAASVTNAMSGCKK